MPADPKKPPAQPDVDDVRRLLRGHGLRSTSQRLAVLDLFTNPHRASRLLTPGQAYDRLRAAGHPIDRVTVYRTLGTLADLGVLHVVSQPPTQIAYGIGTHAPHRAVCRLCGSVVELPPTAVNELATYADTRLGFAAEESAVTVLGICPTCR